MLDISILIPSTDSFSDLWDPCLQCLDLFWPDCPFEVHTISETQAWGKFPHVTGEDFGWCGNVRWALTVMESTHVLMWLEDMLLDAPVDNADIEQAVEIAGLADTSAVLIGPGDQDVESPVHEQFGLVSRDSDYYVSTSPTIWRRDVLLDALSVGGSAWEFEIKGTELSRDRHWRMLRSNSVLVSVNYTAITRGRLERGALRFMQSLGIDYTGNRELCGT